jgi:hypothetical protein
MFKERALHLKLHLENLQGRQLGRIRFRMTIRFLKFMFVKPRCGDLDWIHEFQESVHKNTTVNFRFLYKAEECTDNPSGS